MKMDTFKSNGIDKNIRALQHNLEEECSFTSLLSKNIIYR